MLEKTTTKGLIKLQKGVRNIKKQIRLYAPDKFLFVSNYITSKTQFWMLYVGSQTSSNSHTFNDNNIPPQRVEAVSLSVQWMPSCCHSLYC